MAKYSKFTPKQEDIKALVNMVDAYNQKILNEIPEDYRPAFKTPDITRYLTRNAFNKDMKRMESFIKAPVKLITTKGGVKTTKAELSQIKLDIKAVNQRKKNALQRYNINTSTGTMGSVMANELRPIKVDIEQVGARRWGKFVESMEKQSMPDYEVRRAGQYKKNFLKGITEVFVPDLADELYQRVAKITPMALMELYYIEGAAFDLGYQYSLAGQAAKSGELLAALNKYGY